LQNNIPPRENGQTPSWSFITREPGKPAQEGKQMTAQTETTAAGAPPRLEVEWHQIDWYRAHQEVRRLQARIVRATQEGRWGRVKALQRLLTRSFRGKALAVKRVTENQGKRTPGVDGKIWDTPHKKAQGVQMLRARGYHPLPLRRIYIPKNNGRMRPLGIPAISDRAMQMLHLLALDPLAEVTGDKNSYGFRRERSTADAIEACFNELSQSYDPQWILEGDIKSCFDRISHEWFLTHIPMEKAMLKKWLKAEFIEKNALTPTEEGTPQGGPLSPVIANMALDGLEVELRKRFPPTTEKNGHSAKYKVNLIRYADDFIVTGRSKELLEAEVKPLVERFLRERDLELSQEKTKITHITEGFDFLEKVREIVKDRKQITAGRLIVTLNPRIQGWALYHRHVVSKTIYTKVDRAIYQLVWQWAQRRHPHKGKKWIRKKYFRTVGNRQWVFFGTITEKNGETHEVQLRTAASTPIQRHVKVRKDANPYDPAWEPYFEHRLDVKTVQNLQGKRKLHYLWKEQQGLCPLCHQKITKLTGWHSHHIIWRVYGGSDNAENRVLLHPNCHRQLHARPDLAVMKPRPARGV
jgi:RNA-directed DNA polymerase